MDWYFCGGRCDQKYQIELFLQNGCKYTFGRDKTLHIYTLVSKIASRKHFSLSNIDDKWFIQDHNSSNGTLVNGVRINADSPHQLKLNDEITIGTEELNEPSTRFKWKVTLDPSMGQTDDANDSILGVDIATQHLPNCFKPMISLTRVKSDDGEKKVHSSPIQNSLKQGKLISSSNQTDVISISSDSEPEDKRQSRSRSINSKKRPTRDENDEAFTTSSLKKDHQLINSSGKSSSSVEKIANKVNLKRTASVTDDSINGEVASNEANTKKFKSSPVDRPIGEPPSGSSGTSLSCKTSGPFASSNRTSPSITSKAKKTLTATASPSTSSKYFPSSSVTRSSTLPNINKKDEESPDSTGQHNDPCRPVAIGKQIQFGSADVHQYYSAIRKNKAGPASKVNRAAADILKGSFSTNKTNTFGQQGKTGQNENEPVVPCKTRVSHFTKKMEENEKLMHEEEQQQQQQQTQMPITGTPVLPAPVANANNLLLKDALPSTSRTDSRPLDNRTNSHTKPSTSHQRPFKVDINEYLKAILGWRVSWFEENKTNEALRDKDPLLCDKELVSPLPRSFKNPECYIENYSVYVLHEVWAYVKETHATYFKRRKEDDCQKFGHFKASVEQYQSGTNANLMNITLTLPYKAQHEKEIPAEGDLIILEYCGVAEPDPHYQSPGHPKEDLFSVMAFVHLVENNPASQKDRSHHKHQSNRTPGTKLLAKLQVQTRIRNVRIDREKPAYIFKLGYIRPSLRHLEALQYLKRSLLLPDILNPRLMTYKVPVPNAFEPIEKYNRSQTEAILGCEQIVNRLPEIPRIALIRGPPGTGKTHTIIGLLTELFKTWNREKNGRLRILVCAPSNGAIDEIGRRLYAKRSIDVGHGERLKLNIVRIGQEEQISSDCKKFSLDELIRSNLNHKNGENLRKIREIEEEIQKMDQEVADLHYLKKFDEESRKQGEIKRKHTELTRLQRAQKIEQENKDSNKHQTRSELVLKADIILSTLNSCRNSPMDSLFIDGKENISCVIVDEASQCTEPEIVQPLVFKSVSKLILIGDPAQLPATVRSKTSTTGKFGRSLFARIDSYFRHHEKENPVRMLKTQYRMHSEICRFPSATFYDNLLETDTPSTTPIDLNPYTIFDMQTSSDRTDRKNIFNVGEAEMIMSLLQFVIKKMTANDNLANNGTIGIITAYQGQKKKIDEQLKKLNLPTGIRVDVNTIDGFQGQERDVVILSTVRSGDSVGFMNSRERVNVALTRAKYALIVTLSKSCMQNSVLWDKLIKDAQERGRMKQITKGDLRMDHLESLLANGKSLA